MAYYIRYNWRIDYSIDDSLLRMILLSNNNENIEIYLFLESFFLEKIKMV